MAQSVISRRRSKRSLLGVKRTSGDGDPFAPKPTCAPAFLLCKPSLKQVLQRKYSHHHSGLMPANFITLAHFSVSSAMSFLNWAGDLANGVAPRSASRPINLVSASAALISLLSASTISAGVSLG